MRKVRELTLDRARSQGPSHVSAASSLEQVGDTLFVIADDELRLAVFPRLGAELGHAVRILGPHGDGGRAHKDSKADLESLTLLPSFGPHPHGALLALGSGSGPRRNQAALVPLGSRGEPQDHRRVDLAPLYTHLRKKVEQLNIEGAAAVEGKLRLLQRGNNGPGVNVIIDLDLAAVLDALERGEPLTGSCVRSMEERDLGRLQGVDLAFSDASALSRGRIAFCASAEDTPDSYEDGPVVGSALGLMDSEGNIERVEPVDLGVKLEGLSARETDDGVQVFIVTDADDPGAPSPLLEAFL